MENQKDFTKVFGKLSSDLFRSGMIAVVMHIAADFDLDPQAVLDSVKKIDAKKLVPSKKTKRVQQPGSPDRAKTAYIFFSTAIRPTLKKENGENISFAAAGKLIGEKWHSLGEKEKEKYVKMADEDRKRYEHEMKAFDPKFKPKGAGKKEEKTDLEKHQDGVKSAREKSAGDLTYCHNVSTSRTIKYQVDKHNSDKVWNVEYNLCANNQEDLDHWLSLLDSKKAPVKKTGKKAEIKKVEAEVAEEDVSDLSEDDDEEEVVTKPPPKKAPVKKTTKK